MVNRAESVKQYKNSKGKWKKDIKSLKNQNNLLYIISKKSGSRREIKKINNIRSKASKKRRDGSSNSSSEDSDYDSSLSIYSD